MVLEWFASLEDYGSQLRSWNLNLRSEMGIFVRPGPVAGRAGPWFSRSWFFWLFVNFFMKLCQLRAQQTWGPGPKFSASCPTLSEIFSREFTDFAAYFFCYLCGQKCPCLVIRLVFDYYFAVQRLKSRLKCFRRRTGVVWFDLKGKVKQELRRDIGGNSHNQAGTGRQVRNIGSISWIGMFDF